MSSTEHEPAVQLEKHEQSAVPQVAKFEATPDELARWGKEAAFEKLKARFDTVETTLSDLEQKLQEGNEHAINIADPKVRELTIEVGRKLNAEIQTKKEEKERIEKAIMDLDYNPTETRQ